MIGVRVLSSNTKKPVACVAESGNDEAALVELSTHSRRENGQTWKRFAHLADSLRSSDKVYEPHPLSAEFGEQSHGGDRAPAGGEHRVNQDDLVAPQILRQTLMIELCPQSFLLALESDETDACSGNKLNNRNQHAEGREQKIWREPPSPDRWKIRSRPFHGIADAMAVQWGGALALREAAE